MTRPQGSRQGARAQILGQLRAGVAAVDRLIEGLISDDALKTPGTEGWSVKDHLGHLTAWRQKLLADLNERPGHEALGVAQQVYQTGDEEAINADLQQRTSRQSLAQVRKEYRAAQAALLAWVEAKSDDKLLARYRPQDPQNADRIIDVIPGNSFEHELEHAPWIKAVLRSQR